MEGELLVSRLFSNIKYRGFLISVSHFASDVNMSPRYVKLSTCLIGSPLQLILHMGICFCFETAIHSVFFTFSPSPLAFFHYCLEDSLEFFLRVSN